MLPSFYQDALVTLYHGHVLDVLRSLPGDSVHCAVTSPPYWGLRDYNIGSQVWGGDSQHCHSWREVVKPASSGPTGRETLEDGLATQNSSATRRSIVSNLCSCGAWLGSLGGEPTPNLYVQHLVEIFREVRRVLKDDGTVWLNLGDSYASTPPGNKTRGVSAKSTLHGVNGPSGQYRETLARSVQTKRSTISPGLKPKDLVGIPWRVAFALQADRWYLRSDIIWAKSNPMPESVRDRPTSSHEYLFLLSKSPAYYYDASAIAEPTIHAGRVVKYDGTQKTTGHENRTYPGAKPRDILVGPTRNRRSVWTINTQPYKGAHFATFPEKLVEPCILAGCPKGGIVLDPFVGAGTAMLVAKELGRRAIGIDLNEEYLGLAAKRLRQGILAFSPSRA